MLLPIPHVTQIGLRYANQCGQACITMLLRAFTATRPTIEEVARASGTWDATTSSVSEMLSIARASGLPLQYVSGGGTLAWHEAQIASGVPTIALIDRAKLVGGRTLPHFVVVVGVDERGVYLNDPLRDSGGWRVSCDAFQAAINATIAGYITTPRIALYPVGRSLPTGDARDLLQYLLEQAAVRVDDAKDVLA